jgi:hypothetical protein
MKSLLKGILWIALGLAIIWIAYERSMSPEDELLWLLGDPAPQVESQ